MKKILYLALAITAIVSLGAAQELTVKAVDSNISAGEEITVELNTSTMNNYTVELIDSEDEPISTLELELVNNTEDTPENKSYYAYKKTQTLSENAYVGEWTAKAFNSFEQVAETSFSVVSDQLKILEHSASPFFINENDDITITADITNVAESVDDLKLSIENTTIQSRSMSLATTSGSSKTYATNIGRFSEGDYNYQLDLEGNAGTQSSTSGNFEVFSSNRDASRSDINLGIASQCGVATSELRPPGGGLMALNGSGSFAVNFNNNASTLADVNAELSVTYENDTRWRPEDGYGELGEPMNMSYAPINKTIGPGEIPNASVRAFNKTNRLGYYTGFLNVSASCDISDGLTGEITEYVNYTDYVNFRVAVAGGGEGGEGDPVGDSAIPRDADETGAESNEDVEGDNDNPGQTEVEVPEPDPVPDPVPEPDPIPQLSLNMEALNTSVSSPRGQYAEIVIEIENLAATDIRNVSIGPRSDLLPGLWNSRAATAGVIEAGETVNRSVFLQPGTEVEPGTYSVSILANNERELDLERLQFEVEREVFEPSLRIAEAPGSVKIGVDSTSSIPFLVQNVGKTPVTSTEVEIQNLEECGEFQSSNISEIGVNETRSLTLDIDSGSSLEECQTTIIVSAEDGSHTFSRMNVEVVPKDGVIPPELRFPVFASAWTILLIAYSVVMTRFDLHSLQVRVPFLLLIAGETAIFLYLSTEIYGLIPKFLLPF